MSRQFTSISFTSAERLVFSIQYSVFIIQYHYSEYGIHISQLVLLQHLVLLSVDLLNSTNHQAEEEKVHLKMYI